jgi:hypothetical protein
MDGHAGDFFLITPVEGQPAGTLVHVTASTAHHSRLVLDLRGNHEVLTDARVLLCGHIGAAKLLEQGYAGPLATRPRLAGS